MSDCVASVDAAQEKWSYGTDFWDLFEELTHLCGVCGKTSGEM
jgi:hypothetical protein